MSQLLRFLNIDYFYFFNKNFLITLTFLNSFNSFTVNKMLPHILYFPTYKILWDKTWDKNNTMMSTFKSTPSLTPINKIFNKIEFNRNNSNFTLNYLFLLRNTFVNNNINIIYKKTTDFSFILFKQRAIAYLFHLIGVNFFKTKYFYFYFVNLIFFVQFFFWINFNKRNLNKFNGNSCVTRLSSLLQNNLRLI